LCTKLNVVYVIKNKPKRGFLLQELLSESRILIRVSLKQTKINFGSKQNKICFAFVSVCFVKPKRKISVVSNLYRNNRNKQICFVTNRNELTLNFLKNSQIYSLLNCLGGSSVCFGSMETLCFGIEEKQLKQTVSKQTKKNEKKQKTPKFSVKNNKICSLSNCFGWSSVCFGSIETSKHRYRSKTTETNLTVQRP
jgi:hypothetical protein